MRVSLVMVNVKNHHLKALIVNPNMTMAFYNMSWIFATHENDKLRNGEEAIETAEKLCKNIQYNQPLILNALAGLMQSSEDLN